MAESTRRSSRRHERNQPETSEPLEELDYWTWTVVKLRKELKSRGHSAGGLKADLVSLGVGFCVSIMFVLTNSDSDLRL